MKHLSLVLLIMLLHLSCVAQHESIYVCPPCHSECDKLQFQQPGNCPTCGMNLIPKQDLLQTEEFYFVFDSVRYSAEIAKPTDRQPAATIVIIPGHGKTDFVGGTHYYGLKQFFTRLGFATLTWDKKGCGKTEGTYEHNQSVESSALEAVAAIEAFNGRNAATSTRIGLWGISRGGWICPLIINKLPSIAFWISVSGTDKFDTFRYMVETNLKIEGRSNDYVSTVMKEWDHYMNVVRFGGESYAQLVLSTQKLFTDPFYSSLGQTRISESEFQSSPDYYKKSGDLFDAKTGLYIMVPNYETILRKIECPVLAILGEKDSQVDWRKTEKLYQVTMGDNGKAKLKIHKLPNCNHNMMTCATGGLYENLEKYKGEICPGYYDSMQDWLTKNGFTK